MSARNNDNSISKRQTNEDKSRRLFNVAAILLLLSFLVFLCQLINLGVFKVSASEFDSLPVSIRATSQADYSRDMQALPIPPISENLLRQIIIDIPATGNAQDRIETLQVVLSSPVPTMTSDHLTFTPTRTIEPIFSRTPTLISTLSKTVMPTFIFTPTKSFTPEKAFTSTRTSAPMKTATSTRTLVPTTTLTFSPTATLTPTATPTSTVGTLTNTPPPTPTPTEAIPTDSMPTPTATETTPADTPMPTPTATETTPTDTLTPTPVPSCALTSGGMSISGTEMSMTITNNGSTLVTITGINVNWPDTPESQMVNEVKLGGVTIANTSDPQSPSDYPSERNWAGTQSDRALAVSDSKLLELLFGDNLQSNGYSITITFDNGCTLSESN